MELTPGQQRLLFVVIVLALAGLGLYLVAAHGNGSTATSAQSSPAASASTSSGGAPSATSSASVGVPPATVPAATPVSTAGGAEIYQWLPFTAADLSEAAATTTTFAADYATWTYKETVTAYGAKLTGLVEPNEVAILEEGYDTVGVSQQRATTRQVSTSSGTIDSIRSFGASPAVSITFNVTITQQVKSTQ